MSPEQAEREPIHPRLREALSGVNFTFIDPSSREFLKQAFAEGTHLITPPRTSPERWIINRNMFGTYILSRATRDEVGQMYGISRERVRQINAEVLLRIWSNSSSELKQQFPEVYSTFNKNPKYRPSEWILLADGLGSKIVEALEQGQNPDQIRLQFAYGRDRGKATAALKQLRKIGFDIPKLLKVPGERSRIKAQLQNPDLFDEEIQNLLDQVERRDVQALLASGDAIVGVRDLLISCGFHYKADRAQPFYDVLIGSGIPLGMVEWIVHKGPQKGKSYYHIIASRHRQRAEEALKNDPRLTRFLENPVKQICGPQTKIPTTTKIIKRDRVVRLGSVFKEFGINPEAGKAQKLREIIIANQTVPIFLYDGLYSLPEADQEAVRMIIGEALNLG